MIVTATVLENLRKSFVDLFGKGLTGAPKRWEKVATKIQSSSKENAYGWLSKFPMLREWVGDRVLKSMKETGYVVPNKKFEGTIDVDRADIEDDNIGVYNTIAQSMGQEAEDHIDRNIFGILKTGFANLCYDGQNFFDTDHPVNAEVDGSGDDSSVSNIINPATTTEDPWFLLDTSRPLKPLIYQERTKAEMEAITDPKQDTVFMKDVYLYGVRARRAFGYGFWQQAVACRDVLNESNFNAAFKAMGEFKRDGGDPMGCMPTLLVVGPSNRAPANAVVEVMNKEGGASNPNYKAVEVMVCPWLA